ncbi:MAG: ABC transporter ATP-binding protein [Gammaproteobacteria bacterium]|nr:ABC transporter ATP-binding protein [Gammaproteobacteria bacterium]MYD80021.1 ABC transporter ATP-binding protein [Gammaproteobacteria bacterium]
MLETLKELANAIYVRVRAYILPLWNRVEAWAKTETSRALVNIDEAPEITARRMGSVIVRSVPFMWPMFVHIVAFFLLGLFLTFLFTFTGTMSSDMWDNKMLVNDKMQPVQAFLVLVDESYVRPEFLSGERRSDYQFEEPRSDPAVATILESSEDFIEDPEIDVHWAEYLSARCTTFVGERVSFDPEIDLCKDQRRTVRNRMLVWFAIGEIFGIVLLALYRYYPSWVWQNVNHYLRVAMVERLEHLSLTFHYHNRSGDAIYRIYQDSSMVVNVLNELVVGPLEDIRNMSIVFVFLFWFDPILAWSVLACFIPMAIITAYATPIIRRLSVANRVLNSNFTSRLQETFAALKVVKANCAEPIVLERFNLDSQKALDAALYLRLGMIVLSLIVAIVGGLVALVLEFTIIRWTLIERETAIPTWALVFIGFGIWNLAAYRNANGRVDGAIGAARGFVRLWCMLQDLFIGLERAFYFLDLEPNVVSASSPKPYPKKIESVTWSDVHFEYEDGSKVLRGVNLEAKPGEITAIVGSTGSGKSTLMTLLLRLYDPTSGIVSINGTDLRDFNLDDVRSNTAIALQKNVLFTSTVAENISFGNRDVSQDDIVAAAKIACADEFIQELDDGYRTQLGERGSKLSSGQRQRLTIARAVIRNDPLLILDEPTASLDAKTEHQVLRNLSEWGEDKVVFLITHRLSTIRNADNIAFLEEGVVVETGSHEELMSRPEGRYRAFVQAEEVGITGTTGGSGG